MKKIILIAGILLSSCTVKYNGQDPNKQPPKIETVMNFAGNGVVVDKSVEDSVYYYMLIRYQADTYQLKNLRVPKYEYDKFNIGDTIR